MLLMISTSDFSKKNKNYKLNSMSYMYITEKEKTIDIQNTEILIHVSYQILTGEDTFHSLGFGRLKEQNNNVTNVTF